MLSLLIAAVPALARIFAGDATGKLAEKAIAIGQEVFGTSDEAQAEAALRANPELRITLQIRLAEISLEGERVASAERQRLAEVYQEELIAKLADVANARQRDSMFMSAGKVNWRANVMLGLTFGGIISIIWLMLGFKIDGNTAVGGCLVSTVGTLLACVKDAFSFEFGSSRGSAMKDATIANMTTK